VLASLPHQPRQWSAPETRRQVVVLLLLQQEMPCGLVWVLIEELMIAETKQAEDVASRKHTTASRFRATGLRAWLPMLLAQAGQP
jgi:hypothetical protein